MDSRDTIKEVQHLIRLVTACFYPHQCVLILEALMFHSVLYEEDLLKLTCMHKKVFRSFCNRLVEDRLMVAHVQKEEAPGNTNIQYRWMSRTYYYIHYLEAIDSIKWKVHCVVKQVKDEIGQFNDPQGYVCPTCHAKYSPLDVPSLLSEDKMRFECSVCGDTLIEDDSGLEAQKGQEKLQRLMAQLGPIIKSLKTIDSMKVQDNNFESALIKAVPATSNSVALYTVSTKAATSTKNSKKKGGAADKNAAGQRSQATVHVSITADDAELVQERKKREERNEKLRQNALPSWHRESAVGQGSLGVYREESKEQVEDVSAEPAKSSSRPNSKSATPVEDIKLEMDESKFSDVSSSHTKLEIEADRPPASASSAVSAVDVASESTVSKDATSEEMDALSAYYAQLKQRQAEEEEEEEEDEEDFEDEGDFEGFEEVEVKESPKKETTASLAKPAKHEDDEDDIDDAIFDEMEVSDAE